MDIYIYIYMYAIRNPRKSLKAFNTCINLYNSSEGF